LAPDYAGEADKFGMFLLSPLAARNVLAFASIDFDDEIEGDEDGPRVGRWVVGEDGSRELELSIPREARLVFGGVIKTLQRGTIAGEPIAPDRYNELRDAAVQLRNGVSLAQNHFPDSADLADLKESMTYSLQDISPQA